MANPVNTNEVMLVEREGTQVREPSIELGSPEMGDNVLARLEALRRVNGNPAWVNRDLYRLLFKPSLYVIAYEKIKSSPGNMTPGVDKRTIDGFSMQAIETIINSMRDESFQFERARRVNIPKPNGGVRPLGVASPRDKVVQEAIRILLESIYDSPYGSSFSDRSFGFRAGHSSHSALQHIYQNWGGTTWFIEGDIKGCFDNIDHHRLVEILSKRIDDQRFLNLIWKALSAGYMEFTVPVNSIVGTPQGSIISPILANIYMHELDVYVDQLRGLYEKEATRDFSREYRDTHNAVRRARRALAKASGAEKQRISDEIRALKHQATTLPVLNPESQAIRIKYVRYADDWLISLAGPKALAEKLRGEVESFLACNLKLTLSREKTHIRHAKTEEAFFLGTRVQCGSATPRVITFTRKRGEVLSHVTKRTTNGLVKLSAPIPRIIARLHEAGFCDAAGNPRAKPAFSVLDDVRIIREYNAVLSGYLNYYSFVANKSMMRRIGYILQFSAAKTLAHRHRTSMREVFRKHGGKLTVSVTGESGETTVASLKLPKTWACTTTAFLVGAAPTALEVLHMQQNYRTRTKLEDHCCICGSDDGVEMHHVRHVRKGGKNPNKGFDRIMAVLNRKQIPVCTPCHAKIHAGVYDGKSLTTFADPHLAAR